MNYKQLNEKKKAQIDVLLEQGMSMRAVGRILGISHSTVSRYKNEVYSKRVYSIQEKYAFFIDYLQSNYDWRTRSIAVCVTKFKKYHPTKPCVSYQMVYQWINQGKIEIIPKNMCYKRRKKGKKKSGMMQHVKWNLDNKTVLPISLRPKHIDLRGEIGHLEIDSIVGKKNEYSSIISIVDRCTRVIYLIKAEAKNEYYINTLIYKYLVSHKVPVKSITTDNGVEFTALGICAKTLGVKLYKCDPYCSFQRGTNEQINSLVRRFIPKGSSMIMIEQQYLDDISFKINEMPRKLFDYESPNDIESKYIESGAVEI